MASLPPVALAAFGLHQLDVTAPLTWVCTLTARLAVEFLFLGLGLALLNALGVKNKWLLAGLLYAYYLASTADFVLLWYFKERFGAKYLETMEGGDYQFLTDWRTLSYLTFFALYSLLAVSKGFYATARKTAAQQAAVCAAGLCVFIFLNPLQLLPKPNNFYASYLLPPSPVYTLRALLTSPPKANITAQPDEQTLQTAADYNVFTAQNTGVGKEYKRVILIATESLSAKYLHTFNPLIPPAASQVYDALFAGYPSATLHTVTLSTLYGLTVMFSSHPFAQLSYQNGYPLSFVRQLKEHGFNTAFLRGANENYMDENLLFNQAGFDVVRGSRFFADQPDYTEFIDWWGLTDRKLYQYAAEYLQERKDQKTFLTLLTVDTHVPLGRDDYLAQQYPQIDSEFYDRPTMPRAFAQGGYDLQLFMQDLDRRGLMDDDTLLIVTGDHPSFSNTPTNKLFKPYKPVFDRIPFMIVTRRPLQKPLVRGELVSQLDIAPTVLDLLNLPQQKGFFGHSLFEDAPRAIFDVKEDYVVVTTDKERRVVALNSRNAEDQKIIRLITTFWTSK